MSDLVRPATYHTGGIAASAPGGVLATIPNPPPDIARLPAGTTLRGVVIGNDGKGHVLIETSQGTLAVSTKAHLPINSEVVLQIRSSGAQLHVMIMQVRSQGPAPDAPPQASARPTGPPLAPGGGGSAAAAGNQPGVTGPGQAERLNLGQVVRAVVQAPPGPTPATVAPPPGTGSAVAGKNTLADVLTGQGPRPSAGTILPLRILSISTPGPAPGAASPPGPEPAVTSTQGARAYIAPGPRGLPGTLSPSPGPAAATPSIAAPANAAPGTAITAGTPATVPGPAAAQPAALQADGALAAPLRFTGQVTGMTSAGHPVVSTPLGTLSLEVEARLVGGSRLALEHIPGALPKAVEGPAPMASAGSLAHAWPALEEALGILAEAGTGTMTGPPPGVPQPGARLTSGMLFFMAALSGGNVGRWLGADALQSLRASGHGALVGRLSRDLTRMGRMAESTGGTGGTTGDWRLLPIPLWSGDHVHQLRLFLRQHENQGGGGKKRDPKDPARFILELEMTRLGEIQLDGLIRDKRFDLMMRTRGALPEDMKQDIRKIFEEATQAAGYSGQLGFQASVDWHFLPIGEDTVTGEPPGLLV